ncbi:MAG TPA: chemotaxis protein CheD [Actinoplanes sp.]|nr:chemotaxis protein CheD [Actinoplanes sp.]
MSIDRIMVPRAAPAPGGPSANVDWPLTHRSALMGLELPPGGFYFGADQPRVHTLLGSCVSITWWNRERRIGGMCHYLTPNRASRDPDHPDPRCADGAMALFRQRAAEAGTELSSYAAKIFGGGSQFAERGGLALSDIPDRNVEAAVRLLAADGVPVVAHHVGGQGPRRIIFEVATGDVWVRHDNSLS